MANFYDAMREAAHIAESAFDASMKRLGSGNIPNEPALTGAVLERVAERLNLKSTSGLVWDTKILKSHSGKSAEEKAVGADFAITVSLNTPTISYSKGVLVQAKISDPRVALRGRSRNELYEQCEKMLNVSPASWVVSYSRHGARFGPANKILGSRCDDLYNDCGSTTYRFFKELFECPIGDRKLNSDDLDPLIAAEVLKLTARGQFDDRS